MAVGNAQGSVVVAGIQKFLGAHTSRAYLDDEFRVAWFNWLLAGARGSIHGYLSLRMALLLLPRNTMGSYPQVSTQRAIYQRQTTHAFVTQKTKGTFGSFASCLFPRVL
ncbi:hypothetical protein GCM10009715_16750 [Paeniglutamicibacter psychrophenolicus]